MTLHLYIARRFILSFLATFVLFGILLFLAEIVENLRKLADHDVSMAKTLWVTFLQIPHTLYLLLPLLTVIATITLFISLARSSELVITRASGRSAMRSLASPVLAALLTGLISIAILNPIVAATQRQHEVELNRLTKGISSSLSVDGQGLWLRQGSEEGQIVIRAGKANLDGTRLEGVSFLEFNIEGAPVRRIEAKTATLGSGAWRAEDVKIWDLVGPTNPERAAQQVPEMEIESDLTPDQIRDSFGTPSAISIWDLPQFISRLEAAGFSALKHQMWYNAQIALPFSMIAMVMIAASFTLRHTRMGRTGLMILLATMCGFGLSFMENLTSIMGENGQIPILLAAWGPSIAAVLLSLGALLHLEDG